MSATLPIPISPAVLAWARQESGYTPERVAERLQVKAERVFEWEQGQRPPTFRQVESLARFYHRPLSLFFQTTLPSVTPLAAEYRRLPDVTQGKESPELRLAVRTMSHRRETMLELLGELGGSVPDFKLSARLDESPKDVGARLRTALAFDLETQLTLPNEWHAWTGWRTAVEKLGVLVFQFPKVPLTEARGMSLLHFPLPVAGVNSKEIPEARIYTLVHEVVHLMLALGKEEVPAAHEHRSDADWKNVERFAEEAASHALVPEEALEQVISNAHLPQHNWNIGDVQTLARRFKISALAMATRLRASGVFTWKKYRDWHARWEAWVATLPARKGGFAHPASNTVSRAGRPFVTTVLEALAANRIDSVAAARHLDLKFEHFEKQHRN
ncbi:MAG: helix-turn-helix transcriptional regulator [Puniceicoccales bacterium]|jgi:Zn-dependent peptidase ImmA (M78 family)/transcriptional regulator with XRE-family HTH domain|nr:helix-turn-helix transcriptional regulator [Puniceicoccales bacterium]